MSRISCLSACVLATALAAPLTAQAAGYHGEFWDARSYFSNIDQAVAYANANTPTGTFASTAIDYPLGSVGSISDSTPLSGFLGTDFAGYTGTVPGSLAGSVFRFSGTFLPGSGNKTFRVGSDDGFALSIGGSEISRQSTPRSFGYTDTLFDAGSGPVDFVLTYFENSGSTGVEFKIDNVVVDSSIAMPAVPLPAALPLLGAALAGIAVWGRRKAA